MYLSSTVLNHCDPKKKTNLSYKVFHSILLSGFFFVLLLLLRGYQIENGRQKIEWQQMHVCIRSKIESMNCDAKAEKNG